MVNCHRVFMRLFPLLIMTLYPATAMSVDYWEVEGEHGELHVHGALTEGACNLDMRSRWQEVELGSASTAELQRPGDRGTPVTFTLRLRDCKRKGGSLQDKRSGNLTWDAIQPVVAVRFMAPADSDNPQLVRVSGVDGLGLRIIDDQGQDIRLGDQGEAHFVAPAQDELVFQVSPERTSAPLTTGNYRAVVNFSLEYD